MSNTFSRLLLGLAIISASLTLSAFALLNTVLNPDRAQDIAAELVAEPVVQELLTETLADYAEDNSNGLISSQQAGAIGEQLIANPSVQDSVARQAGDVYEGILTGEQAGDEITIVVPDQATGTPLDQVLSGIELPSGLDTSPLGFLKPLRDLLGTAIPLGIILSISTLLGAVVLAKDRRRVFFNASTWALRTSIFWVALGFIAPLLLSRISIEGFDLLAVLLAALATTMRVPAIVLLVTAGVLFVASRLWPALPDSDNTNYRASRTTSQENSRQPHRQPYLDQRDEPRYRDPLPPRDDRGRI